MTYDALRADDVIRAHGHTPEEVSRRLGEMEQVARRHLADAASGGLSPDGKHNLAYTAGRVAAEMVMLVEGYRSGRRMGKHAAVFVFLAEAVEGKWSSEAVYFDKRRERRNVSEYEQAGTISPSEADAVLREAGRLLDEVVAWAGRAQSPN